MCCTTTSFSSTTSPIPSISAHPSSQRLSSSGRSPNSMYVMLSIKFNLLNVI